MTQQLKKCFFDPSPDRKYKSLPARPDDAQIALSLARNNKACALNKIIVSPENEGNFRILHRFSSAAYRRYDRNCRGFNHIITAPPGQGKTFIEKAWAETIGIPFVFVQSSALKSTYHLFQLICKECEKYGTPVVPLKTSKSDYTLPPVIVFFDEAHEINLDLQKGALLNPMEPDDGFMHIVEPGTNGETLIVDCKDVCWVAATTDPALLFDAFRSRFLNRIEWAPAGKVELPLIIKAGLDEKVRKGELSIAPPLDACQMIAHYQQVPRNAIHGFGFQVCLQKQAQPLDTWDQCCQLVASDLGIDKWGLTRKQVALLSALGQRPTAKSRLGVICKCRTEQVEQEEMPGLMQYTNGGPFVIVVTGRGVCITEAGLRELDKRGISHAGRKVTAEYFESKR